ncbi:MAG TPA: hypothetical protein VK543_13420 [Puia sp.]|nr:hypothetical protein [Puia sp.]
MKKTILALAVILTVGLTSAFAKTNEDISQSALASFKTEFAGAKNVSWQQAKDYAKVTFTLNDQVMYAYYSHESNELMAVVRNILSDQLPINLASGLKKDFSDRWISGLFEVAKQDHTSYYATVEDANEMLVLKSINFNEWTVYKRTKKM